MIDEKFTKEIQEWLATPDSQKDIPAGATMLLRMNRNRILYTNIIARPQKFLPKLIYELQKHLKYRLDRMTLDEVVRMNRTVIPAAAETLKTVPEKDMDEKTSDPEAPIIDAEKDLPQNGTIVKGKRPDHGQLPPDIQQLWTDNADLYFRIKQLFETLKTMESSEPCDRYEYLKQLDELDKTYRKNMDIYDHYVIGQEAEKVANDSPSTDDNPKTLINKINASRKYLSENKVKLAELKESDPDKYVKLLAKVQERYDFLMAQGQNLEAEQTAALQALGVVTETSSGE